MYQKMTVANVALTLATTEYSYAIPTNTRKIVIKERSGAQDLRIAFEASGTTTAWITVPAGSQWAMDGVYLRGQTIYIYAPSAPSLVAEVLTIQDL